MPSASRHFKPNVICFRIIFLLIRDIYSAPLQYFSIPLISIT